ncbi:hypothetical protein [Paucilactobacillus nenjiangensis]|jgi:hypothetical protein|uniref:hypothetical protein n=1 Tax=Paucilactobacillus nenjiangensis TaxID=1296540 RepID=UPI003BB794BA
MIYSLYPLLKVVSGISLHPFIKIVNLIPKSREIIYEDQLREKKFQEEQRRKREYQKRHETEYERVSNLMQRTKRFKIASEIEKYSNSEIQDLETKDWALKIAHWLNGQNIEESTLTDRDKDKLVDDYDANEKSNGNSIW